ncbi:unnamed protein product [Dibothriocephalus latus]|uniref:G-protein coupled receptors family 1 profile domain-containing protein n=1 Tax=Dibothriocephalus latus TaxID=60516 RepID=A0A3P7LSW7_DIBLA|nr:unnamed protein product [Dibothriocephalus latus]
MADPSKLFWSCQQGDDWPNSLDICELMVEVFGVIANFTVTIVLFLLRVEKSEVLALLRVLPSSCPVSTVIDFLHDVGPPSSNTGKIYFDGLVCLFWSSRFLYWYSKVHVYHSAVAFAHNRAFKLLQLRYYRLTTERRRLTAYMLFAFIGSFLAAVPQLLGAQPQVKNCACASPIGDLVVLSVVYAHSYLMVAFFAIIYPALLVYISIALLLRLWKSTTMGTPMGEDEMDKLAFPDTLSPSEDSLTIHSNPGDLQQRRIAAHSDRSDWPASFCIKPLTVAYIATFTYDAVYQLLSATGTLTYVIQSPRQTFGEILLIFFTALVPLILFFHIPAMRSVIYCVHKKRNAAGIN